MEEKEKDMEQEEEQMDEEESSEEQSEEQTEETSEGTKDKFGRTLFKAKCADCGKECEVPFKPDPDRPVYCRDCFRKHRPSRPKRF